MGDLAFAWDRAAEVAARFAIIIPARFASTRYPGKPLAMIAGPDGTSRSLIERSWRAASGVAGAQGVWVATEDARVAEQLAGVTQRLGIPHLFEASFDKASRSSLGSFRGPGIFDVTRALQRPGGRADSADGRGGQALRDLEAFLARVQAVDRAVKG